MTTMLAHITVKAELTEQYTERSEAEVADCWLSLRRAGSGVASP